MRKIKENHKPVRLFELKQHIMQHDASVAEQQELKRQQRQQNFLDGLRVYEVKKIDSSALHHETKVAKQIKKEMNRDISRERIEKIHQLAKRKINYG